MLESNKIKKVLITGVNRGIGKELTERLVRENYYIIGSSRANSKIDFEHENFFDLELDITSLKSIKNAKSILKSKFKKIDILINNAGIGSDFDNSFSCKKNFIKRFETNLFGTYFFTELILPIISIKGQIVNISSKLGSLELLDELNTEKFSSNKKAYILSKTALNMYTKLLSNKLIKKEIIVTSVHPGWVKTNLSETNKNAPFSTVESANGIYKILLKEKVTSTFWDAITQEEIPW